MQPSMLKITEIYLFLARKGFCVTLFYNAQVWFDHMTNAWCFTCLPGIERTTVLMVCMYVL